MFTAGHVDMFTAGIDSVGMAAVIQVGPQEF